jgi:hypothetical protein
VSVETSEPVGVVQAASLNLPDNQFRNGNQKSGDRQCTTQDAQLKIKRLYPQIKMTERTGSMH